MPNDNAKADADIVVTDDLDAADAAVISDGLRAYYVSQAGYYDFRPLAVFVRDPQTGKVIGGLHGRSEFGLVYVAWLPARGLAPRSDRNRGSSPPGNRRNTASRWTPADTYCRATKPGHYQTAAGDPKAT
jgi:hypothetical protein